MRKMSCWLCQMVIRHGVCIFTCILFVFFMVDFLLCYYSVFLFLYVCVIFVFVIWFKLRLFDLAQRWSAARTVSDGEAGGPKVLPVQTLYTLFEQISRFLDFFGISTLLDIEITISTISRFERFCLCRDSRLCKVELRRYIYLTLFILICLLCSFGGASWLQTNLAKHQVCIYTALVIDQSVRSEIVRVFLWRQN